MRRMLLAALVFVLPLAACEGGGTGPDDTTAHVGAYNFISLNGTNLPASIEEDGVRITFLSGRITLNADGTASHTFTAEGTDGSTTVKETVEDVGTYTRSGTAINLSWSEGEQETYAFSGGNTLTLSEAGFVAVFRK